MRSLLLASLPSILAMSFAGSAEASDKTVVTLGTATPGGGFPVYGEALALSVNETDPSLEVRPTNTAGSFENIPLLEAGTLDIGLVQGEAALEALNGIGRPQANLRVIFAMYATPGMFMVRADSPYHTIDDLKGKPVVFGAKGSGLPILARYVLDGLGLDRDRDFEAILLERAGDGPQLVSAGKAAALWGGGSAWPGFTALAKAADGGRFIVPDAEGIRRIRAKHSFLETLTVPAGSFPGQPTAMVSVGSWSFILSRPTLPDALAYRLTRALNQSEARLAARLPQARETTAANTVASARRELLHPGTLKYLEELGLVR
ncbi:MAG TPA: TAXI family TRAP transporter solute-binding subunit [Hyphomicrobiaceae bacterium]|nr:TAXI family TRAP transporter solute-binding subunit [Hyphomicrobiaceae bacterium]